ncbi:MAG: GatB/YqeY domain-containing protein [Eubacterium sp.]|nr:GatB/YqeY domain-containing protein [Eubacterium sp.]
MGLKEELMNDFKQSMKAHDEVAKNTISLARAAIKQYEVDKREELDDEGILVILKKQVKMRKDALADFEKAGRSDLVEAYNNEIRVLEKYIPEQMSKEQILEIVKETAESLGIEKDRKSMGKLMGPVMGKVKGLADGSDVRDVVMNFLSGE